MVQIDFLGKIRQIVLGQLQNGFRQQNVDKCLDHLKPQGRSLSVTVWAATSVLSFATTTRFSACRRAPPCS